MVYRTCWLSWLNILYGSKYCLIGLFDQNVNLAIETKECLRPWGYMHSVKYLFCSTKSCTAVLTCTHISIRKVCAKPCGNEQPGKSASARRESWTATDRPGTNKLASRRVRYIHSYLPRRCFLQASLLACKLTQYNWHLNKFFELSMYKRKLASEFILLLTSW